MTRPYIILVALLLGLTAAFPSSETYWRLLICQIGSSALLAISFDICLGFAGLLTMATALFSGLGAFIFAYVLQVHGIDIVAGVIATELAVLVAAVLIGALAVRLRGPSFLVFTLLMVSAAQHLAQSWRGVTGGDDGFSLDSDIFTLFGAQLSSIGRYYFALAVFALGYFSTVAIVRSPLGLLMRSVRENDFRVELLGLNPYVIKMVAFSWGALLAGLAGIIYAATIGHVDAGLFDPNVSGQAMLWGFFGGVGTLAGPMIGAAVLVPFEDYMSTYIGYPKLFTGVFLVVIVLTMRREGVLGLLDYGLSLLRRRRAGKAVPVEVSR